MGYETIWVSIQVFPIFFTIILKISSSTNWKDWLTKILKVYLVPKASKIREHRKLCQWGYEPKLQI